MLAGGPSRPRLRFCVRSLSVAPQTRPLPTDTLSSAPPRESHIMPRLAFCTLALMLVTAPARGELVALEFHTREPFADGKAFGDAGPYERLVGVARFAVDSAQVRNKGIIDLGLAPR